MGVQYTQINGFHQETCNFYPFETIEEVYIFESIDGLKIGHFLNIRRKNGENEILFENMKPPIEFIRRVYRKFQETKRLDGKIIKED